MVKYLLALAKPLVGPERRSEGMDIQQHMSYQAHLRATRLGFLDRPASLQMSQISFEDLSYALSRLGQDHGRTLAGECCARQVPEEAMAVS
jgi:hypothetical protein